MINCVTEAQAQGLLKRHFKVLDLADSGVSNEEIAQRLGINQGAVTMIVEFHKVNKLRPSL